MQVPQRRFHCRFAEQRVIWFENSCFCSWKVFFWCVGVGFLVINTFSFSYVSMLKNSLTDRYIIPTRFISTYL